MKFVLQVSLANLMPHDSDLKNKNKVILYFFLFSWKKRNKTNNLSILTAAASLLKMWILQNQVTNK